MNEIERLILIGRLILECLLLQKTDSSDVEIAREEAWMKKVKELLERENEGIYLTKQNGELE